MAGWESSCTMGELRRLTHSVCWKCDFPHPSLHPSSQPALGGAYKSLLPPTGDDTWRTESTASALAVLSHGFPGARWATMRQRCFSPWGISGSLLLVPVWFLSLLCVGPNLLLCCSARPSDVYVTADNVRILVCSECLSCFLISL